MTYTKQTWADGSGGGTPLSAPRLQHMEDGIDDADIRLDAVEGSVSGKASAATLAAHTSDTANPHAVTKAQVGLGSVDNTADAAKPVSAPQQAALDALRYTPATRDLAAPDTLTLTRLSGNPVLTQAAQNPAAGAAVPTTAGSLYWPWVVDARAALGGAALNEWYLYYSTDHDATGGIWLATAPGPTGPWTGRGRVYLDTVSGSSTETPSVLWNPDESLFFMYYQQSAAGGANGAQSTVLATSPDGITWTRVGVAVDIPAGGKVPGDGHTGYFRPFRVGRQWFAHHLYGGGDYSHSALSYSPDGRTWDTDPRLLRYGADQFDDALDFQISWNSGNVVSWRGQLWWIGIGANFTSGGAAKVARTIAAPLSRDLRSLVGKPAVLLYPTVGANESTNYRSLHAFVDRTGRLVVLYQCDNNFNAAVGV